MAQTVLTFITRIKPDRRARLEELLTEVRENLDANPYVPFASLTRVHFASFVIIDNEEYGPYLIFENNFDDALDTYLDELLEHAGRGLHEIYTCCLEYAAESFEPSRLKAFLKARVVRPSAYHIGNVGRSAKRIKQECALRERIEDSLDELIKSGKGKDAPASLRRYIQNFVKTDSSLAWAIDKIGARQTFAERIVPRLKIYLFFIVVIILSPVLALPFIIWLINLRRLEKKDRVFSRPLDTSHIEQLNAQEDRVVQNHLASITIVKQGWFRRFTLRTVLWVANLLARTSTKGELRGIRSIHFAHWSLIDNGRRLLFLSNYDGSWMSYLDDFIDKAASGLTGIWSNTDGFPETRFLILDGARNEAGFKAYSRYSQTPALVWYSAYPDLTVQNIDNDSLIREDLFTTLNDDATRNWLRRF
ncbi:MAG TPA: hypothetical protein VF721_09630 [Pyrinomonadaceae bacterium]|jgi:hypothetical protein